MIEHKHHYTKKENNNLKKNIKYSNNKLQIIYFQLIQFNVRIVLIVEKIKTEEDF